MHLATLHNRLVFLLLLIAVILVISIYVNIVLGEKIVYTHLYYLPIILTGLWYHKKAVYVALFLALFHVGINLFQDGYVDYSVLIRGIALLAISYVFAFLAEKKDQALTAFNQEQQEKALILDNLTELIVFLDNNLRIKWASPTAEKVFGKRFEKNASYKCYEIWQQRNTPCEDCPVALALKTGDVHFNELKTTDGRHWRITGSPVFDDNSAVVGAVEIALEITGRKKAEEELKALNVELEQRVRERTAELERLVKELDAFSYSVSHDLRSPLYSIEGFSQALLEDYTNKLDDQGRDYLLRVSRAVERMNELIDDLLKLSRVTRQKMEWNNVDLSAMVNSCLAMMKDQDPQKQVEIRVATGLNVTGDASLLRIALENLLGNAWKFTNGIEPARIEFGATVLNGSTVYYIKDNGVGFDIANADRLFQPFKRLHEQGEFAGTGIGLSIVARIIKRHGGDIWADGAVGQGATFYFTLFKKNQIRMNQIEYFKGADHRGS